MEIGIAAARRNDCVWGCQQSDAVRDVVDDVTAVPTCAGLYKRPRDLLRQEIDGGRVSELL
jgi:hypothetical protein